MDEIRRFPTLHRPWKSCLGLLYVQKHTFFVDLKVIWLTVIAIVSRDKALNGLQHILKKLGADDQLLGVARRQEQLQPYPPPGSDEIVMSRKKAQKIFHRAHRVTEREKIGKIKRRNRN